MVKLAESIKPRLDTEEAPFEGRVPDAEVEKDILAMVAADKAAGLKNFYLIDGQHHETVEASTKFLLDNFNAPKCMITCLSDAKEIESRFKEKNEIADDLGEEDANNLREKTVQAAADA